MSNDLLKAAAKAMGKKGGAKTLKNHGRKHFLAISKLGVEARKKKLSTEILARKPSA